MQDSVVMAKGDPLKAFAIVDVAFTNTVSIVGEMWR
jgi:hypothetical protein